MESLLPPVAHQENTRRARANLAYLRARDGSAGDLDPRSGHLEYATPQGQLRAAYDDTSYLTCTTRPSGRTYEQVRIGADDEVAACQVFSRPGRPVEGSVQFGQSAIWTDLAGPLAQRALGQFCDRLA